MVYIPDQDDDTETEPARVTRIATALVMTLGCALLATTTSALLATTALAADAPATSSFADTVQTGNDIPPHFALPAGTQDFDRREVMVPMRDGVKLFTAVYVPKDDAKTYPVMLIRTPYSVAPYGADKYPDNLRPGALFAQSGYIFAYQDVREIGRAHV